MSAATLVKTDVNVPTVLPWAIAVFTESIVNERSAGPTICDVRVLGAVQTVFEPIFILFVFVPEVLFDALNIGIITRSPTARVLAGITIDSNVTSEVNSAPAFTDSLVKSAESGAEKVMVLTSVREKLEYQPAERLALPG
jgi:hypothetical protein